MLLALSGPWSKTIWHLISKVCSFMFGSNALGIGWVFRTTKPIELFQTLLWIRSLTVWCCPWCIFHRGKLFLSEGLQDGLGALYGELVTDNIWQTANSASYHILSTKNVPVLPKITVTYWTYLDILDDRTHSTASLWDFRLPCSVNLFSSSAPLGCPSIRLLIGSTSKMNASNFTPQALQ